MRNLTALKRYMRKKNIGLSIITSEPNMRYFTGQPDLNGVLAVFQNKKPLLFVHPMEKKRASSSGIRTLSVSRKIRSDVKERSLLDALKSELGKVRGIGFEKTSVNMRTSKKISGIFPGKSHDISGKISEMREVKDPDELRKIRKAARLADRAMLAVRESIRPGMTELQLASIAESEMRKEAQWFSFNTIVASGRNSANPHHATGRKKISARDLVIIDLGAVYNNYCSDTSRTLCIRPSKKQKRLYETVMKTLISTERHVKNNTRASLVHNKAANLLSKEGFEFIHATGHGIGIEVHEAPHISHKSKDILKANSVITLEPAVYTIDHGGVRIEDMYIVTRKGHTRITKSPRGLVP